MSLALRMADVLKREIEKRETDSLQIALCVLEVMRKPDWDMVEAGRQICNGYDLANKTWEAMIDAASGEVRQWSK